MCERVDVVADLSQNLLLSVEGLFAFYLHEIIYLFGAFYTHLCILTKFYWLLIEYVCTNNLLYQK